MPLHARTCISSNASKDLPLSVSEHKVEGKDDPYHQTEAGIQDYGGQESHKPNSLQTAKKRLLYWKRNFFNFFLYIHVYAHVITMLSYNEWKGKEIWFIEAILSFLKSVLDDETYPWSIVKKKVIFWFKWYSVYMVVFAPRNVRSSTLVNSFARLEFSQITVVFKER